METMPPIKQIIRVLVEDYDYRINFMREFAKEFSLFDSKEFLKNTEQSKKA